MSYLGYREKVSRQVSRIGEVSGLVCVLPWLQRNGEQTGEWDWGGEWTGLWAYLSYREKVISQVSRIGEVSGLVCVLPWLQRESEQSGELDWGGEWAGLCLTLVTERK